LDEFLRRLREDEPPALAKLMRGDLDSIPEKPWKRTARAATARRPISRRIYQAVPEQRSCIGGPAVADLPGEKVRPPLSRGVGHCLRLRAGSDRGVGRQHLDLGLYSEAWTQFDRALNLRRRAPGTEDRKTLRTVNNLGRLAEFQGNYAEAIHALFRVEGCVGPFTGKPAQSESLARDALAFYRTAHSDGWERYRAESLLGASLAGQRKYAEAEPLLLEGYQGMDARRERIAVPDLYRLERAREWLAQLYQAWGKPERAAEWKKK
jgi:hypothetical protein